MGISETIIQFVLYEHFRSMVEDIEETPANARYINFMLAGATAKLCASAITYPHGLLDLFKRFIDASICRL